MTAPPPRPPDRRDSETAAERDPMRAAQTVSTVDSIRRIVRALRIAARRTETESGMSAAQLFVLSQLSIAPANSLSELGERTLTDRSSVAAVVDRLVARGFVHRGRSPDDRRRTIIHITAEGQALLATAPQPPTTLLIAGLAHLPTSDLASLAQGLQSLTTTMGIANSPATFLFESDDSSP